jgi:hypothetical protein
MVRRPSTSSTRHRTFDLPSLRPSTSHRHWIWPWRRPPAAEAADPAAEAPSGARRRRIADAPSSTRSGAARPPGMRFGVAALLQDAPSLPCVGVAVGGGMYLAAPLLQDPATLLQDPAAARGGGGGPTLSLSNLPVCGGAWWWGQRQHVVAATGEMAGGGGGAGMVVVVPPVAGG